MLCPVCRVEMVALEFEQVEVDFCLKCRGVWLDGGELEMIGERAGALHKDLLRALESRKGEVVKRGRKRRCPVCGKALLRVKTAGEPVIEVDRCPREHGIWFDAGELSSVVRAAGADEGNILARFFHDLESDETCG